MNPNNIKKSKIVETQCFVSIPYEPNINKKTNVDAQCFAPNPTINANISLIRDSLNLINSNKIYRHPEKRDAKHRDCTGGFDE